jgi:hypothetical protein
MIMTRNYVHISGNYRCSGKVLKHSYLADTVHTAGLHCYVYLGYVNSASRVRGELSLTVQGKVPRAVRQ